MKEINNGEKYYDGPQATVRTARSEIAYRLVHRREDVFVVLLLIMLE